MSYPRPGADLPQKISCFKCGKLYAVVKPATASGKRQVVQIEKITWGVGSDAMKPLLKCSCGYLNVVERGLFPFPHPVG